MTDVSVVKMNTQENDDARWLLLIHQIPPKPTYLRVKIWRRLQKLGAVPIKNSVYALPRSDQAREDFHWVLREIVEGGGDGTLCEARLVDGIRDNQVESLFLTARTADYKEIAEHARRFAKGLPARGRGKRYPERQPQFELDLARLKRRLEEVGAIDFFGAPGREAAAGLIADIESRLKGTDRLPGIRAPAASKESLRGKTWVTRKGVHVDRIATAWLVRRFIDPEAGFKFVPAKGYRPLTDEIRFDMFEAEFTHVGDRCTMEVLVERTGIEDKAVQMIAEIVHDIDLKDSKFEHPETPGIERLIGGIAMSHKDDEIRLQRGAALLDDLYGFYAKKKTMGIQ
jgi:hypothetical protein